MNHRTLAELAKVRGGIQHAIDRAIISKAITDGQRAEREERLAGLHVRLSILLSETENASWGECPDLAPTLRYAIYGADKLAQHHTAEARRWRAEEVAWARKQQDIIRTGGQP